MSGINWTRWKATNRGREAARAAVDNWFMLQRVEAKLEAGQREAERKARAANRARQKREREIARLKRLWAKVRARGLTLD